MEKDLKKFNEKLEVSKEGQVIAYNDDKGIYFIVALAPKYQHIAQLLLNCEYIEADEPQYKSLLYNGDITKNLVFNEIKVTRPASKYEVTKKEKDRTTIVDKEVVVKQIWIVKNGFKLTKAFNNLEEAIAFVKSENEKLFNIVK